MDRIMLPQRPVWLGPRGLWSQLSVLFPGSGARRPEPFCMSCPGEFALPAWVVVPPCNCRALESSSVYFRVGGLKSRERKWPAQIHSLGWWN